MFAIRNILGSKERNRFMMSASAASRSFKTVSPPLTYIAGEEMTRYCMELILKQWVHPYVDTQKSVAHLPLPGQGRTLTPSILLSLQMGIL